MKSVLIKYFFVFGCIFFFISCNQSKKISSQDYYTALDRVIVLNKEKRYDSATILDKEVTIYPGAFLITRGAGKIIFSKTVNIIGDSQVFDENANVIFGAATISSLNPCWFGAKGYDDVDDTEAFQKMLKIARDYPNSVSIEIPIGKFIITESLEIGNTEPNGKSINLIGRGMSANSMLGSSLVWNGLAGKSMLIVRNNPNFIIDGIGINAETNHLLKHDIELRPFINQLNIKNCSFTGCSGPESANINLNSGNDLQVSEINIENCLFGGVTYDNKTWLTESAVIGGLANTKNFYFKNCSFLGYSLGAINIHITDIMKVENCGFAFNDIDIICDLCNTMASSNYSERSNSFFKSTISQNVAFTTLMDNCFYGSENADFVIRGGAGSLVLINNNFGGMGGDDQVNKIKWDDKVISNIYSIGNFYKNGTSIMTPFYNMQNQPQSRGIHSINDMSGLEAISIRKLETKNY